MRKLILIVLFFTVTFAQKKQFSTEKIRKAKNTYFKYASESPLSTTQKKNFKSLNYYPYKKQYIVYAKKELYINKPLITFKNNKGESEIYIKYAKLHFKINGSNHKLTLYQNQTIYGVKEYQNHYFLPFTDFTNKNTTYQGGRFIDLIVDLNKNSRIKIDFNLAYNPYCAYNTNFICPIPPKENQLKTSIKAGEKRYY